MESGFFGIRFLFWKIKVKVLQNCPVLILQHFFVIR